MVDRKVLLDRLEKEDTEAAEALRSLILDDDMQLVSTRVGKVTVSEARRLWRTRLKNTEITGQHLDGANALLESLDKLTPQRKLEQFALSGNKSFSSLFFVGETHSFVGAIVVHS